MLRSIRKPRRLGPWHATGKKTSRHRGVSWKKTTRKWEAEIRVSGKKRLLGFFDDEDEARRAFVAACRGLPHTRAIGADLGAAVVNAIDAMYRSDAQKGAKVPVAE